MNIKTTIALTLFLNVILALPPIALSQQDDVKAQAHRDASIKRMQARVTEIESEMKVAEFAHAQALGEEAFNLYGQIDQTFLQMKNAYQQQVIQLNQRMQRKWERVESDGETDRDAINDALTQLEKDWERTFERLTVAHKSHLDQLKDSLAKLQGEFSEAVGRAKAELQASNFEAIARWEEGHELFLALNKTYVQIVASQLDWQQQELARNSSDKDMADRLAKTRIRFANIQGRFQRRLTSHINHLDEELTTRLAQLSVTQVWAARREIMEMVDELYTRKHTTFETLQTSYQDSVNAFSDEAKSLAASDDRAAKLKTNIKATNSKLGDSFLTRVEFIADQIGDYESRISVGASMEETATWTAKITDLRLLSRTLKTKATQLVEPIRTVRR